jgi:hypothetical protein
MVDPARPCAWGRVQTKLGAARDGADSSAIGKERAAIQRSVWRVIHVCGIRG